MDRRSFIKKSVLVSSGTAVFPYVVPGHLLGADAPRQGDVDFFSGSIQANADGQQWLIANAILGTAPSQKVIPIEAGIPTNSDANSKSILEFRIALSQNWADYDDINAPVPPQPPLPADPEWYEEDIWTMIYLTDDAQAGSPGAWLSQLAGSEARLAEAALYEFMWTNETTYEARGELDLVKSREGGTARQRIELILTYQRGLWLIDEMRLEPIETATPVP